VSTFHLEIALVGEAFQPEPGPELARLLKGVSYQAQTGLKSGAVVDLNGNRVGSYWVESEERADA